MSKCQCCGAPDAYIAWQPFGPGEDIYCFPLEGWHERGFPAVKICEDCKELICSWQQKVTFTSKGKCFEVEHGVVKEVDALPASQQHILEALRKGVKLTMLHEPATTWRPYFSPQLSGTGQRGIQPATVKAMVKCGTIRETQRSYLGDGIWRIEYEEAQ